jgi:hypothetical protein
MEGTRKKLLANPVYGPESATTSSGFWQRSIYSDFSVIIKAVRWLTWYIFLFPVVFATLAFGSAFAEVDEC